MAGDWLEAAMLTADLNDVADDERLFMAAQEMARRTGHTGAIQGPTYWTMAGERCAPVEVFDGGRRVDGYIKWMDD